MQRIYAKNAKNMPMLWLMSHSSIIVYATGTEIQFVWIVVISEFDITINATLPEKYADQHLNH